MRRSVWLEAGLFATLVALGVVGRLIEHWPNFTPMVAIGLFAGIWLPSRLAAVAVPLTTMLVADWVIGADVWPVTLTVYAALLVPVLLGGLLARGRSWPAWGACAVGSSLLFFLVTNFAVWAFLDLYSKSAGGLIACYVAAWPFFKYMLAGDLFYVGLLGSLHALAARVGIWLSGRKRPEVAYEVAKR